MMVKLARWVKHNPQFSLPVMAVVAALIISYTAEIRRGEDPPAWWVDRHNSSRQIKIQAADTAQIVVPLNRIADHYIPTDIEVVPGGEGVVLRGPKNSIYNFHRKIFRLDENEHGIFGLAWKTE